MRQRTPVDVLELPANRHTVGDPAGADTAPQRELAQEVRGGLALDRGVRGENELPYLPFGENRLELAYAELLGPDAVERRQVAHEHEVAPAVAARGFDRHHVRGRLDRAQQCRVALRRGADRAQ